MKKRFAFAALLAVIVSTVLLTSCIDSNVYDTSKESDIESTSNREVETDMQDNTYRGEVEIDDIYAWVGYPASDFIVSFTKPEYAEKLTFSYDTEALEINENNNTIKALKTGTYTVDASSEHFSVSFTVKAENVDKNAVGSNGEKKYNPQKYQAKADNRLSQWNTKGNSGKTTVFIGDSFFDTNFWSNFYQTSYPQKDALCLGISATTSYDWESWSSGWLKQTDPKNIVMHMGTNNVYDDGDSVNTAVSSLQRMFTVMHSNLPNAKIYWFGISYRSHNTDKINITRKINEQMKIWCEARDYITYVNTPDKLTTSMLKDGTHPKVEYYSVFTSELANTDIEILDLNNANANTSISDLSFTTSQMIKDGSGNTTITYKNETLTRNYILSGKLDITKKTTNSHVHFAVFDGTNNRILLWDHASNGNFKLAIPYNTSDVPQEDIYTLGANSKITIEWKLVVTDDDAYFYINGELKLVYAGYKGNVNSLRIGSEATESRFYDITAITKASDSEAFSAELQKMSDIIAQYGSLSGQRIRV